MDCPPQHTLFSDPEQARQALDALTELAGEDFSAAVGSASLETGDPLRALVGMTRFVERSISPKMEAALALASPRYLDMLTTLFFQSRLMTDILCRNPEYASWLWEEAVLDRARSVEEMLGDLRRAVRNTTGFAEFSTAIRRFSRRQILRIATREVWLHQPFSTVAEDISNLADTAIEAAIEAAAVQLSPKYGRPTHSAVDAAREPGPASFVVLGMGKLGGRELNFSSDIDLLFIYSDHGETTGGSSGRISNEVYFNKLGELIIKAVSESTRDGMVFRVDMRLRPFGKSGPLASAFDQVLDYYMNHGRAWERQALIKARPCAGDLDLGTALLEKLRPFIFPRYFDDATLEDIRHVKGQTEARTAEQGKTEREVKLGRGGIRDIEFTVQMLQLLNGGRWPDLRTKSTLEAIQALGERQSLSPFEAVSLSRHYVFLRQAEHRLQIEGGQQIHALPEQPQELDQFARKLGYSDGESFMRVYREHTGETRRILERFLASKGAGHLWVAELLDPQVTAPAGIEKLKAAGFQNPEQARSELLLLANGPENARYTREVAQYFASITPALVEAFAAVPCPDTTLLRLGQVLAKLPAPGTLYDLLRCNPSLCRYFATLIANSDYLCSILVRDISLLDLVGTPSAFSSASTRESLESDLAGLERATLPDAAPYRLRDGEMLKVALRELVQGISVADVGDELTVLAEVILANALQKARFTVEARYGTNPRKFAILALGKFGGREMGYGSDMDLVFVHEHSDEALEPGTYSDTEYFPAIASHTLKSLKEPTRHGILYDIDARLRPDGSKGVLSITDRRLAQYYTEEAQPQERFALMKARAVAGDPDFAAHIDRTARDIAFSMPLNLETLERIEELRAKAASVAVPLDLKRHEGSLAEVEFATRILQLQHVLSHPRLKWGGVFKALAHLKEQGLADASDCDVLAEAYGFYRRIINRVRMMNGSSTSKLPEDDEVRSQLAARLNMDGDMMQAVQEMRTAVHAVYERIYTAACTSVAGK
jgi:glutamate-ammonia-ligase adenylyltransferase